MKATRNLFRCKRVGYNVSAWASKFLKLHASKRLPLPRFHAIRAVLLDVGETVLIPRIKVHFMVC